MKVMKRFLSFVPALLICAALTLSCGGDENIPGSGNNEGNGEVNTGGEGGNAGGSESGNEGENPGGGEISITAKGADLSWLSEMEHDGVKFRDAGGKEADVFESLQALGMNAVRLRVWVDPPGGWSGKDDAVALAERAGKLGLDLMIDFHYSDFFADPGKQDIPAAWLPDADKLDAMAKHVSEHTADVLEALKDKGITPKWVQIGNETTNGMLWDSGRLWTDSGDIPDGRKHFATLLNAGYEAAKKVFPDVIAIAHIDNAYEYRDWWFEQIKAAGGKFDMIGLSHYPQTSSQYSWKEMNAKALTNIEKLGDKFGCPVMVVEIGTKASDQNLAAQIVGEFVGAAAKLKAYSGVFYWEPEVFGGWKPAVYNEKGWGSYDMGAFDSNGRPGKALTELFK